MAINVNSTIFIATYKLFTSGIIVYFNYSKRSHDTNNCIILLWYIQVFSIFKHLVVCMLRKHPADPDCADIVKGFPGSNHCTVDKRNYSSCFL